MTRFINFCLIAAAMLWSMTARGADAGWYFYVYFSSVNTDWGQFQTTSTANEFVIEDMAVTVQGINFCVRSSNWSTKYGWSDTGGSKYSRINTDSFSFINAE